MFTLLFFCRKVPGNTGGVAERLNALVLLTESFGFAESFGKTSVSSRASGFLREAFGLFSLSNICVSNFNNSQNINFRSKVKNIRVCTYFIKRKVPRNTGGVAEWLNALVLLTESFGFAESFGKTSVSSRATGVLREAFGLFSLNNICLSNFNNSQNINFGNKVKNIRVCTYFIKRKVPRNIGGVAEWLNALVLLTESFGFAESFGKTSVSSRASGFLREAFGLFSLSNICVSNFNNSYYINFRNKAKNIWACTYFKFLEILEGWQSG